MRVLQVIDVVAPVGGAQRSVLDTMELLETAGHEVMVVHGDAAVDGHIRSARYSDPDVSGSVHAFNPDLVHLHGTGVPSWLEPMLNARPVVHSLHDFSFACSTGSKYFRDGSLCTRSHGLGCVGVGLARGCLHRVDPRPAVTSFRRIESALPRLRAAAAIVVHSRFMHGVALQSGLPADRVSVIPLFTRPGVDGSVPGAARIVAFAGRITPEKGLDLLIDALSARPDAWDLLLVAGEGWDRDRCERLARDGGIADRIEFRGHLDSRGVRETLAQARVVAVPSRWPEPFGLVGLEAMAVGRPVVATAVGGIPEWLDDGRTGILVPPRGAAALGQALGSLLADPARAAELGAEGRRQVERFSREAHLQGLLAVYERATEATGHPASEVRVA
jgi:glycosyltransferase involved in cell wall biosynthesis